MVQRVVEVVDPDPGWPAAFAAERDRIEAAFAEARVTDEVVAIEHIGSTSVPGLAAKPIIDVLIGVRRWPASAALIAALEAVGYVHRGEAGIVARNYLQDAPSGHPRTRQVHVVEHGTRIWRDHVGFRDHLRTHDEDRDAYGRLKQRLARRHRHDIMGYLEGKRPFIREILARIRAGTGEAAVSPVAADGFAADPARYERARPGYPPTVTAWLAREAGITTGSTVADLGAGTGKLARALLALGAHVLAVEPVAAMRTELADLLPAVQVVDGTAEDLPLPAESLDAVTAAQSFHWFDAQGALSEAHRVLRPGGFVVVLFNTQDETVPWVAEWTRLTRRVRGDAPDRRTSDWHSLAATTELFDGPHEASFDNPHPLAPEVLVERLASSSFVAALDDRERAEVLEEFRGILERHPETRGREEITVPYRTEVHLLRRVP